MTKYNVFGDRLLVNPILVKKNAISKEEVFEGVVEVLAIGHKFDTAFPLSEGDKLLVSGYQEAHNDFYVLPTQILRKL